MPVTTFVSQADQALNARRVFGDPIERDGVTVIPVAQLAGGGGGTEGETSEETGEDNETETKGVSGGIGLYARPAGVYVVKGDTVRWVPAVDVNRMVRGFTFVAIVLLLVVRSIAKWQAKAARGTKEAA